MTNDPTSSPISWEAAQTFLAVVEHASFSAAAEVLAVGQPTISRRVAQLESSIGEQLFVRGRYGAEPTAAAQRLIPAAEQMARWAGEFGREARRVETSESEDIAGLVTVAAPPGVAVEQLAPVIAKLQQQHRQLRVDVLSSVVYVDLSRGEADIAIRTQTPSEPELIAVHRAIAQLVVVAAPSYAATVEAPCDWADLDWITWTGKFSATPPRPMLERVIDNFSPRFASDDYLVQKAAARAGMGAFVLGALDASVDALAREGLVEIPMRAKLPAAEFYIVCAKSARHVARVNVVLDALIDAV